MSKILINLFEGDKNPKIKYKKIGDVCYKQNPAGGKWVKCSESEYNEHMGIDEFVDEKGGKLQGDHHIDQSNKAASSRDTTDDAVHKKAGSQSSIYRRVSWMTDKKSLEEVAKGKMKNVVEDILSKKNYDKDVIDRVKNSNGIPDVSVLKETLPVLMRKISHIKTLLDREEVGGDEKAILLNSLLSVDLTDIPSEYKRELARKLGY
jgi:hypothetical protein